MQRYRINQLKLGLDDPASAIEEKIRKTFRGLRNAEIRDVEIVRRSLDARGTHVKLVLTVDFSCNKRINLPSPQIVEYDIPHLEGTNALSPVVVGFGPCGMFAALVLARAGLKPIVLERGLDVDSRVKKVEEFWKTGNLDPNCNVQFGEGGAGTFSDGKLNTGIKDPRIRFVLKTLVDAGADPDVLIDARPHIGTDELRGVVKNIRKEITELGGEVRFAHTVVEIDFEDGVKAVLVKKPDGNEEWLPCENLILAIGHSARDTFRYLNTKKLRMEPKPFSMGVRVEHDQEVIDRAMYGEDAGHPDLPPAYYKLATKVSDGRGVYSFCMCPGGEIINAASQEGMVVTNGMSNHGRDSGKANSGILVDVRPTDFDEPENPMSGIDMQEKYERLAFLNGGGTYNIPETTWGEFYREERRRLSEFNFGFDTVPDSTPSESASKVIDSLPDFVAKDICEAIPVFGRKIKGFDDESTVIKAIESRSSSPVRILRDPKSLEGYSVDARIVSGFYPAGEGAGYAGGITSAACDGIKIAERIISKYTE